MRLIIEDLEGATTVVDLGSEDVTIGRKPHNTIQLTEQNVSRSHAKLHFRDDGWIVEDLASYNGVKVNGVPISEPTLLRENDLIQIGDYHLTLTDDIDRQTVDIERPRAANDNMAMSSAADLPAMSVEDLGPAPRPEPVAPPLHGRGEDEGPKKKSNAGLIIGGVLGLAAIVGLGALFANMGGDDAGTVADSKSAEKGEDKGDKAADSGAQTPPNTDSAGVAAGAEAGAEAGPADEAGAAIAETGGEELDAGESGDDAAGETGEELPGEEIAETGGDEPEPPPQEKPKPPKQTNNDKPKPPKENKPKLSPEEALKQARKASMAGNNRKAYNLAKDAYSQSGNADALNLMGVAACKMGSASKAKSAYRKMSSKDKPALEKICGALGIEL